MASSSFHYVVGGLYPLLPDGSPNLITADNLVFDPSTGVVNQLAGGPARGRLNTSLAVTTDPITVPGVSRFILQFYLPQLFATQPEQAASIFNQYRNSVLKSWTGQPRNQSMTGLLLLGYKGPGAENANTNDAFWNSPGSTDDAVFAAVSDRANYDPESLWKNYGGSEQILSTFDQATLLQNLAALNDPEAVPSPDLWYPSFLYTYQRLAADGTGLGSSYPGPVLMVQPNSDLRLNFSNQIAVPGLSEEQNQQATLVENSTYGLSSSSGLGGTSSINYHLHGSHTTPAGFGDNVIARYTTGQSWTTEIDLPDDHGQGSYWYHPHYHPSVNQQVYGGLSGFLQLGDPLSKVPAFSEVPRNLAVIKNLDLAVDPSSGTLQLAGFDGGFGPSSPLNRLTMATVNGEFQPNRDAGAGGWQAFSFSNQSNADFYNISFLHTPPGGDAQLGEALPLFLYGEDGHQYPQIREAVGALGATGQGDATQYLQQSNLLSLPPGKRLDVLVYLPQGRTEIASTDTFRQTDAAGGEAVFEVGGLISYPSLTSSNTGLDLPTAAAGPLAVLTVNPPVAELSLAQQQQQIAAANAGIAVQEITPDSRQADYNPNAVPSINLYATDQDGQPLWEPVRQRMFSFSVGTLVGPPEEYDAATQQQLAAYTAATGEVYQSYEGLPIGSAGVENWLGYEFPLLINDHVFPNGNLTIAQLGTIEEWTLRNWSVFAPESYVGHPFHIHINDYQVLDSDTELSDKRNLEDVTSLNTTGFRYFDTDTGKIVESAPYKGQFHSIPQALDPNQVGNLATFGANDETVRMLFQDYLGTYVFHCHILPHEDAGMMQAVMVVENTDSSWLLPAEGLADRTLPSSGGKEQVLTIHQAQGYRPFELKLQTGADVTLQRGQAGDVSNDFIQDVVLASEGDGRVRIVDGRRLLERNRTKVLSTLKPYATDLAPWAYAEDFSGNGQRDLVTGGFTTATEKGVVSLHDFRIKAWASGNGGRDWSEEFGFDPWDFLSHHDEAMDPGGAAMAAGMAGGMDAGMEEALHDHASALEPLADLSDEQVGFVVGDFNLDNFNDFAIAYAIPEGIRVSLLDGAAFTLLYQTGQLEGGYLPNENLLADAVIHDASLKDLRSLNLTSGFNSFGQSALENLLITTDSARGRQQLTLQLHAGHFIATSEPSTSDGHVHGGGQSGAYDDRVTNLSGDLLPLHLVGLDRLPETVDASTPILSSALGNGGLLLDDRLLVAQGNGANGIDSDSRKLLGTSQQLVVDLEGLEVVNEGDLSGVLLSEPTGSQAREEKDPITGQAGGGPGFDPGVLKGTYGLEQTQERNNLANLVALTYGGSLPLPGTTAQLAAQLAQGANPRGLVQGFLADPLTGAQTTAHYGGSFESLSTEQITSITIRTLYGREAREGEQRVWREAVAAGLSPALLPLAILRSTGGDDRYRVALISNAAQWNVLQWGSNANVLGAFGQGFQPSLDRFAELNQLATATPSLTGWKESQDLFRSFQEQSIAVLGGTPVSDSGFF
ncbi:multicopper oxidase family protein [Synechococcus sp. CS-1328]|uniref:multicopper oxidase family protein n=1 Tax=Synechococcus sp. CS-1328 TaxID=2847976 RepID=UPI00223AF148|nr:multicopper oxidase domain-containing protein [Synechococcus sp. CS-1328]MCT0225785.1 multicopper oxidase domain-containing protein [Synechococcus sp. CS-1328]MCT0225816.1 multicopper oxidase domain-containing protein [Synechococcus sp. CS-1328]